MKKAQDDSNILSHLRHLRLGFLSVSICGSPLLRSAGTHPGLRPRSIGKAREGKDDPQMSQMQKQAADKKGSVIPALSAPAAGAGGLVPSARPGKERKEQGYPEMSQMQKEAADTADDKDRYVGLQPGLSRPPPHPTLSHTGKWAEWGAQKSLIPSYLRLASASAKICG